MEDYSEGASYYDLASEAEIVEVEAMEAMEAMEAKEAASGSASATNGFQKTVAIFQFLVEGLGILTVGSIGLVINIIALYILFRKQVSPRLCFFLFIDLSSCFGFRTQKKCSLFKCVCKR